MTKHYILKHPERDETVSTPLRSMYPDWELVGEANRELREDEEFDPVTKKLKVNKAAKAAREEEIEASDLKALLRRVRQLEADVAELKGRST